MNFNGGAIGCSVREKLWIFDLIQTVRARAVERYCVNDECSVVLRSLLHVPADLPQKNSPDTH